MRCNDPHINGLIEFWLRLYTQSGQAAYHKILKNDYKAPGDEGHQNLVKN